MAYKVFMQYNFVTRYENVHKFVKKEAHGEEGRGEEGRGEEGRGEEEGGKKGGGKKEKVKDIKMNSRTKGGKFYHVVNS